LWPPISVLVHGDFYAGHILVDKKGQITGIIDWSEAKVNDPSIDFARHQVFFVFDHFIDTPVRYESVSGAFGVAEHIPYGRCERSRSNGAEEAQLQIAET